MHIYVNISICIYIYIFVIIIHVIYNNLIYKQIFREGHFVHVKSLLCGICFLLNIFS